MHLVKELSIVKEWAKESCNLALKSVLVWRKFTRSLTQTNPALFLVEKVSFLFSQCAEAARQQENIFTEIYRPTFECFGRVGR
jgi:hypothetical protein